MEGLSPSIYPDVRQGVRCPSLFLDIWVPDIFEAPLLTFPGRCETCFPSFIFSHLCLSRTDSWQWSGNVPLLLSSTYASVCSQTFIEGFPSPLPAVSARFSCGPQLCWSRSSSTNHMILDSFAAVRTTLQSSCETRYSCCFTSVCLQKATAGSCDTRAASQAPEISALPLCSFFESYCFKS